MKLRTVFRLVSVRPSVFIILTTLCCGFSPAQSPPPPSSSAMVPEASLGYPWMVFPFVSDSSRSCSSELSEWIKSKVGKLDVSCEPGGVFGVGLYGNSLIADAGVGLYPFIAVDRAHVPVLRIAVVLPAHDSENLKEFRIVADQNTRVVQIPPETERQVLELESASVLTLDLSADVFSIEFLRQLATAERRFVFFGKDGKRKVKIGGRHGSASIAEMMRLYDAIEKEALFGLPPATGPKLN